MKLFRKLALALSLLLVVVAGGNASPFFPYGDTPGDLVESAMVMPIGNGSCGSYDYTLFVLEDLSGSGLLLITSDGVVVVGIEELGSWALLLPDSPDQPWKAKAHFDDSRFQGGPICPVLDYAKSLLGQAVTPARFVI